jgi:MFS family permease
MSHMNNSAGNRRLLTLSLLSIAFFFSLLDRQILTVLVDPIKRDLTISDTQFGLLQGLAFAVFYIAFAVPVAMLADRWNRKVIIVAGLTLWSLSTAFAGLASSFGWLFAARIGVGVGEACLTPAAYSMLTDLFERKKLGKAIGSFHTVGALGIAGAVAIGGVLYNYFVSLESAGAAAPVLPAWGMTLAAVGLPGVVLALLIAMLVREPARSQMPGDEGVTASPTPSTPSAPPFKLLIAELLARHGAFVRLLAGGCLLAIAGNAFITWTPAYLMRAFEMTPAQAGLRLGASYAIGAIIGPLAGGAIADALYHRLRDRGHIVVLVACSAVLALCYAAVPFASSATSALIVLTLISIIYSAALVAAASTVQLQAPTVLRAQISALALALNTLVGLGLGALLVGVLNDKLFGTPNAVGSSLAIVAITSSLAGAVVLITLLRRGVSVSPVMSHTG